MPPPQEPPSYAQSAAGKTILNAWYLLCLAPAPPQPRNPPRSNNRNDQNQGRSRNAPALPQQDFDFESFNAQFNKEEVLKEFAGDGFERNSAAAPLADPKNYYDKKSSFFDNISCDSKNKAEGLTRYG